VLVPTVAWTLESMARRKFLSDKIIARSTLWVLPTQLCQTIGGNFFSHAHIDLRLGKLHVFPKTKYKTVGDALTSSHEGS